MAVSRVTVQGTRVSEVEPVRGIRRRELYEGVIREGNVHDISGVNCLRGVYVEGNCSGDLFIWVSE